MTLANTIVAENDGPNCNESCTSLGRNLDDDDTCGLDPGMDDLIFVDPLLEALADNGGPTPTHALASERPAIDAGDESACPPADQRGVPRPIDGDEDGTAVCDMGAYEYEPPETLYLPAVLR